MTIADQLIQKGRQEGFEEGREEGLEKGTLIGEILLAQKIMTFTISSQEE